MTIKKILFIGINQRFINSTYSLLPTMVSNVCDTYFFGPGFSSQIELEGGIEKYLEKIGPVDFFFVTSQCLLYRDIKSISKCK